MPFIEVDAGIFHHNAIQSFSIKTKVPTIYPSEIGTLNRYKLHRWQVVFQKMIQVFEVTPDVVDHLLKPGFTMIVCSFSSDKTERVCTPKTQRPQFDPKFLSKLCIGHNNIRCLQTSQAECLARRRTDENVFQKSFIQRTVADELPTRHDQVTMKLVSNYPDTICMTDLSISGKFFPAPDAPHRIVWTT